ncbi:MAG TPA: alkaline phosphatase family protein [Candidatus Thermoplasmatota archaeon]|nr:alkaline phosphatase family protein [Candidatus Thermoplasmatota archaeon]
MRRSPRHAGNGKGSGAQAFAPAPGAVVLVIVDAGSDADLRPDAMPFLHGLAESGLRARLQGLPGLSSSAALLAGGAAPAPPATVTDGPVTAAARRLLQPGPAAATDCDAAVAALGQPDAPPSLVGPHARRFLTCDLATRLARDETTYAALARALRDGHGPGLYVARLRALDRANHRHGPGTPPVRRARRIIDRQLAAIHAAVSAGHRHWSFVVVGDHAAATVDRTIDLRRALLRAGAARGDVALAVGPTLAAAWARTGAGRRALDDALAGLPGAVLVAPEERRATGLAGPAWGDALLAVRPGSAFWPESGGFTAPLAVHGYLDAAAERPAFAVVASTDAPAPRSVATPRPLADIAPTVCDLLGVPPLGSGRSLLARPLARA